MPDSPKGAPPKGSLPKGPLIIELDQTPLPPAPSPADAPQPDDGGATAHAIRAAAPRGRWGLGRWTLSVAGGLLLLWLGVGVTDFVTNLFARDGWLGWLASGLLALFVLLVLIGCLRELAALARLGRIEGLRELAASARETGSTGETDKVLRGLGTLYARRPELERAQLALREAEDDAPDPEGRLALAERMLMTPLDTQAEASIARATRNVAAATALIPLALIDVLAALVCNLRMIREIAEIYGGRTGWLGAWRLMRAVAAHLVATGAVAVADDMLGPLVGGGVLAKVSRRFGEGAVNGALTARVGVAAMDICRPLPFAELPRPRASAILLSALKTWRRPESVDA